MLITVQQEWYLFLSENVIHIHIHISGRKHIFREELFTIASQGDSNFEDVAIQLEND